MTDLKRRINELRRHHEVRANEALTAVTAGGRNAYQIASKMTWDVRSTTWDSVPIWQRVFATGETIAHLNFLETEGKVRREVRGEETLYSIP